MNVRIKPRNPITPQEWQEAVDAAKGLVVLEAAKKYGLVTGGPEVNIEHCLLIMGRGLEMGIRPSANWFEQFQKAYL